MRVGVAATSVRRLAYRLRQADLSAFSVLIFRRNLFTFSGPPARHPDRSIPTGLYRGAARAAGVEFAPFVLDDVQKNWTRILAHSPQCRLRATAFFAWHWP